MVILLYMRISNAEPSTNSPPQPEDPQEFLDDIVAKSKKRGRKDDAKGKTPKLKKPKQKES